MQVTCHRLSGIILTYQPVFPKGYISSSYYKVSAY